MKQRVITSLVGLAILFAILAFYNTMFLNVCAACVILLSLYEMLQVLGVWENKPLALGSMAFGAVLAFLRFEHFSVWIGFHTALFGLFIFLVLLKNHETLSYEKGAAAFCSVAVIGYSIAMLLWMRETSANSVIGLFYLLLSFALAWLTDTGAFLFGVTMGKHKMAPKLSPKKTVEGALGGIAVCVVVTPLLALLYSWICTHFWDVTITIDYARLLMIAPAGSLLSMVGDLSASLIKRQRGVKDYGSIMPGHGGIMDRFDSVLFVIPAVYLFAGQLPIL